MPADINISTGAGNIDMPEAWLEYAYDYCEYLCLRKDRQIDVAQLVLQQFEQHMQMMVQNGDYMNAPDEFIWDGPVGVPRWIADPNY
jgi:hypothetical protein